ncbi:hypothetical protein MPSI1_003894 [Malassezia psittaci]|uniref:Uncharacterized protein n=1 Tax=Malassezia psittaci TaxID=1821823 RepID=A0AAF0F8J0_9BASI|nr:hypothetical protein MPSI1_003894 [Malassezia psittaci]
MSTKPATEPLSARQESRLVMYLDQHILQIQRQFQKRFEPNASLPTLHDYLAQWTPILDVIAATPLQKPTAPVRDAYLLRLTTDITEGIIGYALHSKPDRDQRLQQVLYWIDVLDQLWTARIRRIPWTLHHARQLAHQRFPDDESIDRRIKQTESMEPVSNIKGTQDDSIPAFDQTDRVRLRDVLAGAEHELFGWMRDARGLPRPPDQDPVDYERELQRDAQMMQTSELQSTPRMASDGHNCNSDAEEAPYDESRSASSHSSSPSPDASPTQKIQQGIDSGSAALDPPSPDGSPRQEIQQSIDSGNAALESKTEEQRHYDAVFEQKLDPDADDDDQDDEDQDHEAHHTENENNNVDLLANDAVESDFQSENGSEPPLKRIKKDEKELQATELQGYWDTQYASTFARTLQELR